MNKDSITLVDNRNGKKYDFNILRPSKGVDCMDIRTLYSDMNIFTFDPGFTSTASCESNITFIDGEKGELLYRGYDISDLAVNKSYIEVCYLLLNANLPNNNELSNFDNYLRNNAYINEKLKKVFAAFPDDAHPMAILSSCVCVLCSFHYDYLNISTDEVYQKMSADIIAKLPTMSAFIYRHLLGKPFIYPDLKRSYTENFLYMLRANPSSDMCIEDVEIKALDTIFTLHADHEQNASTSTVRGVASTNAHPYISISAGINALWGKAHGGANESVMNQLELIANVKNVEKYIKRAKDPQDSFRLMGFGHRVYKNFDPRSKILKDLLEQLKDKINVNNELFEVAHKIEEIALKDEYFIQRKLYPNVDFYSGLILTAIGIPKNMFTVIFTIGRAVGWISQFIELKKDNKMKIARPRQLYKGSINRKLN